MKTCRTCGEAKPVTEYHRHARTRDRLDARCKECKRAWADERREAITDARRAYYAEHQERLDARSRAYHEKNPHVRWLSRYMVRARRYGIEPAVTPFTEAELIDRHGSTCKHCGGPFEELDHYPVPVALGGAHSLENCVPSCAPCNRAGARTARDARALTRT